MASSRKLTRRSTGTGALGGVLLALASATGHCGWLPWSGRGHDGGLRLVDQGHPAAVMLVPNGAEPQSPERRAAIMLAEHLQQMSGASLMIREVRELPGLRVEGRRLVADQWPVAVAEETDEALFPEGVPGEAPPQQSPAGNFVLIGRHPLVDELGVDMSGVGLGGIRLKTTENALVLLGGPVIEPGGLNSDSNGVVYAVIDLLERLGCAFLWPTPSGKIIPRRDTVAVGSLDVRYTPQIQQRGIRFARWHPRSEAGLKHLGLTLEQVNAWRSQRRTTAGTPLEAVSPACAEWRDWQRLNGGKSFGHAGGGLRADAALMAQHPEWFALQADGTRDQGGDPRWQLCVSNPDLIRHVADDIIEQVRTNPALRLASLDMNDGGGNTGFCLCEACRALDPPEAPRREWMTFAAQDTPGMAKRKRVMTEGSSLSDRMVYYWNGIAERVTRVHPDLKLGISIYSLWQHPPVRQKLHPNLVARYVPGDTEHLKGWQRQGLTTVMWRPNILLFNRRDGMLKSYVTPLAESMNTFVANGIRQTDFDSIMHAWSTAGLSYYAAARLTWNPRLRADEIIREYCRAGFGKGSDAMEKFFWGVEALSRQGIGGAHADVGKRRYHPEETSRLRRFLRQAERDAAGDAGVEARIAFLRLGLNFTELQETLDHLAFQSRTKSPDYDAAYARLLLDLNLLMIRDMLVHQELAVNLPMAVWGGGGFYRWRTLSPKPAELSDAARDACLNKPGSRLTGREDSLADLLQAFELTK